MKIRARKYKGTQTATDSRVPKEEEEEEEEDTQRRI